MCTQDIVMLTPDFPIDREVASIIIVCLDCLMMVIFSWAVLKLRLFERLTIFDIRNGKMRIEDFSVCVRSIPIKPEEY